MDAPTTTSADGGSSGGNSGDWGWFNPPAKKSSGDQQERQNVQDRQGQDGRAEANDPGGHDDRGQRGDFRGRYEHDARDGQNERERIPSRPFNPTGPVGTAATREREAEPQQVPQPRRETGHRPAVSPYAEQAAAGRGYSPPPSPFDPPHL